MERVRFAQRLWISILAVSAAGTGCVFEHGPGGEPPPLTEIDPSIPLAQVVGRTHDPEAMFISVMTCGSSCQEQGGVPYSLDFSPIYARSKTDKTAITTYDPEATGLLAGASASSNDKGDFFVPPLVPLRDPPYYLVTEGGTLLPDPDPSLGMLGISTAEYVPAITLHPVRVRNTQCIARDAYTIGENGILQAVAKYRTAKGTPTTVADLRDPTKTGGISIWFAFDPDPDDELFARRPAADTTLEASAGQILHIDWAYPGTKGTLQSARGFFVNDTVTASPHGITAVVLDVANAGKPVTYRPVDTVTEPVEPRPWIAAPLEVVIPPGMVGIGPIFYRWSNVEPHHFLREPYVCLVDENGNY